MAKIRAKGSEKYLTKLELLHKNTDGICKHAVYEGAKVAADAIDAAVDDITIHNLPNGAKYYYLSENDIDNGVMLDGLTKEQAQGLHDGLGIAAMKKEDGSWNTKIGFDGYNGVKTKTYPNGEPNALIARSVESGSSIRNKTPFIAPAVRKIRRKAEKAMDMAIEESVAALFDE